MVYCMNNASSNIVSLQDLVNSLQQDIHAQEEIVFDELLGCDGDEDDSEDEGDDSSDDDSSALTQAEVADSFLADTSFTKMATNILDLIEQRRLCSARWKWTPNAVLGDHAVCHSWLLENRWWQQATLHKTPFFSSRKTAAATTTSTTMVVPPRFILVVFPRTANLNLHVLQQAIQSKWKVRSAAAATTTGAGGNNNNNIDTIPMAWQLARKQDAIRLFGEHCTTTYEDDHDVSVATTTMDLCPLVSVLARPHQAARVPVICCRTVSPYLWMPVYQNQAVGGDENTEDALANDNDDDVAQVLPEGTTMLGMSIRDLMNAVQPYLVTNLSTKRGGGGADDNAAASTEAVKRTAEVPKMPKHKKKKNAKKQTHRHFLHRTTPSCTAARTRTSTVPAPVSTTSPPPVLPSQNQSIAAKPSMVKASPTGGSIQSIATTASTTSANNSSRRAVTTTTAAAAAAPVVTTTTRRLICRNDNSVTPNKVAAAGPLGVRRPMTRPSANTRRGGRRANSFHTSENDTTEESSTVFDTALDTDDDEEDDDSDDDYPYKSGASTDDDNLMLDGLLSDDDDLAMLNELASTADTDTDDMELDFEETATTGDLEDALLDDDGPGPVTERVDSRNRVTRIQRNSQNSDFVRSAPSRSISVEEHDDFDPECIEESKEPVVVMKTRPRPASSSTRPRRRKRGKLRGGIAGSGANDFIRRAPSRALSTSEHPEFEMEGIISEVQTPMAKASAANKDFARSAPSRAISMSEHPDFDVEECITEAKPPSAAPAKGRASNFTRKTPSRAISTSEHPDFDVEEWITEAKPAATTSASKKRSNFTRKTPSRAMSTSEHPDFDVEQCITEARPANAKPSNASRAKNFNRSTPSRAISTSEHPDFDVEECITEAKPAGQKNRKFTRRTPSRAISTSEHPDFDMEENITEAVITEAAPASARSFSRQTPSRAISTSEHPDFDVEDCIMEVKPMSGQHGYSRRAPARTISTESYDCESIDESCIPAGLSADIAEQIKLDLQQDRKEQALVEAALASESAVNRNMLEESMPTPDDLEHGECDETCESEDISEEEETIDAGEDYTDTQNFPSETDITETGNHTESGNQSTRSQ